MPMTTLGLSTLFNAQLALHSFDGLYTIGLILYFIGLVQFVFVLLAKATKFVVVQNSFTSSFNAPEEALFSAALWISCYGAITAGMDFASPAPDSRLSLVFLGFFWIYLVCVLVASTTNYLLLFHKGSMEDRNMTPAWLLPILPVILVGVMAGSLADKVNASSAYAVVIAGLLCSSAGFLLSISINALYLHRLFIVGLPVPDIRPAMMIAVGPPTYAPLAFLKMAATLPAHYGFVAQDPVRYEMVQAMAFVLGLAIWGLGVVFLLMAICSILRRANTMSFHLTWYGLIFPNVGLLSSLGLIGTMIPSEGVIWVASVGTILLTVAWLFVTTGHIRAIVIGSPYLW